MMKRPEAMTIKEDIRNSPLINEARKLAFAAHAKQKYGNLPYGVHLNHVYSYLYNYEYHEHELLAAAYLHDIVEDTGTPIEEIAAKFGKRVGELVWAVTNEPGANRKERAAKTYPKIAKVPGATALKLADRIANTEFSKAGNLSLYKMYRSEYPAFRQALFVPGEHVKLWDFLDYLNGYTHYEG